MAYSSTNPPRLMAQAIAGSKHWHYESTDVSTAVAAADYFSNGYQLGMRVGDRLSSVVSSSYNQAIGAVSVASSSGPCTVIFGSLVST